MVFLYGFCLGICLNSWPVFLQWWVVGINPFFSKFFFFGQNAYHNKENQMMTRAKFPTPKPLKICTKRIFTIYSFLGVSFLELFSCGKKWKPYIQWPIPFSPFPLALVNQLYTFSFFRYLINSTPWPLSHRKMPLKFIHVAPYVKITFLFEIKGHFIICLYQVFLYPVICW